MTMKHNEYQLRDLAEPLVAPHTAKAKKDAPRELGAPLHNHHAFQQRIDR